MRVTIGRAERLIVPKALLLQVHLTPGMTVDMGVRDGHIEVAPARSRIELKRQGRFLVAVADADTAPLTCETVEATRQALRLRAPQMPAP